MWPTLDVLYDRGPGSLHHARQTVLAEMNGTTRLKEPRNMGWDRPPWHEVRWYLTKVPQVAESPCLLPCWRPLQLVQWDPLVDGQLTWNPFAPALEPPADWYQ